MSKAKDLAAAISARLAQITVANGYATDIGAHVYRGQKSYDEANLPFVCLHEGEDAPMDQRKQSSDCRIDQKYIIEGHVGVADLAFPNDDAHDILADIKRAIFSADIHLDGRALSIKYEGRHIGQRENGLQNTFAQIIISISYVENLANP